MARFGRSAALIGSPATAALAFGCLTAGPATAAANGAGAQIFVSPIGNDQNPGTHAKPVKFIDQFQAGGRVKLVDVPSTPTPRTHRDGGPGASRDG